MLKLIASLAFVAALVASASPQGRQYDPRYGYGYSGGGTYGSRRTDVFLESGETWKIPDRSGLGVFNRMVVTTPDVPYSGSGSVTIPFTLNQPARGTVVIYAMDSNETGETGPNNAWIRLIPQAKYVWHSPLSDFDQGDNSVEWDGKEWNGEDAGPGAYEYDVIAFNDFEANLVGTGHAGAWGQHSIDTSVDPPETWSPFQERPPNVCYFGTVDRDYIANPNSFELWTIAAFDPSERENRSGNRPDDLDRTVHWTSRSARNDDLGAIPGIIKLQRNDDIRTLDIDTSYGENGQSSEPTRVHWVIPYKNVTYNTDGSSEISVRDKEAGEVVEILSYSSWFTSPGIALLAVNESGIYLSSPFTDHFLASDFEGNVRWVNTTGDGIKDWLTAEGAAELDIPSHAEGSEAVTVAIDAHATGKMSIAGDQHNHIGYNFGAFGRDGTGLFFYAFDPALGPYYYGSSIKHIRLIGDGTGKYDGMYPATAVDIRNPSQQTAEGSGMLIYIPFGIFSGSLGDGVTAIESGNSSSPDTYSLSAAYPNPFNSGTTIDFTVPAEEQVKIEVFNPAGQVVASLVEEVMTAGSYKVRWDGRDKGESMASGVYFIRMKAGEFAETRSITFLK